jgi:outer membrane protein assembly factor BamB
MPVTITGTAFTGATAVQFGSTPATTFTVTNDSSIAATAPAGSAGPVDVSVTTAGGPSSHGAADVYTYITEVTQATYRGDLGRSGYYGSETGLTTANAASLKLHWTDSGGSGGFSQPIVANNMVYWSDWTGNEHGTALTGTDNWTTNVGTTTPPTSSGCVPASAGPTSTPAAAVLNGTPMLFLGGGNGVFYALNAQTGAIVWQTLLGSPPANFLWDSPALYNGIIYMGLASYGDCPLVQGKLFAIDASTGAILHTANMVPNNCTGGGIWASPTVDTSDGSVWVTTGTPPSCGLGGLAPSIVKLRASDLTVLGSWTVPAAQQAAGDPDFGSTPTLFSAVINGQQQLLVGASDKDGLYYAWSRTPNAQGQLQLVWQTPVGTASSNPATSSIVSAAWDGTTLYVGGGVLTINGTVCQGNVDALDPATGAYLWQACLPSHIEGGITAVPGLLVIGDLGVNVFFLATSNGATLFDYHAGIYVAGECTVSNGVVYIPGGNGTLIALGQ